MNRKFKNKHLQQVYDRCRERGPTWVADGAQNRGNGYYNAYWLGYDGATKVYVRNSEAELAYKAGTDNRNADMKDGTYKRIPTTYELQKTRLAERMKGRT